MSKKRILIVADDPTLNTGYARVGKFLAQTLHDAGYWVRYLPTNANVPDHPRDFSYELESFDQKDRYNNRRIGDTLTSFKPSLTIVIGEFAYVGYIGNVCRQYNIRSMYYTPVEGNGYPPHVVYLGGGHIDFKLTLMKFHYIVAYSEFGKENIHKQMPGIVTETIPHQVDTNMFRPLDKKKCLETFFPNFINDPDIGMDKIFIVGAIYRNQRRKGVDYLFKGFKHFIDKYEDLKDRKVYMFAVMDPKDTQGYNISNFIDKYDLKGRIILNPVIGGKQGPADNQLVEIYNTFDVHCCPFRAEGFGYPIIESLACGIKTVATNYASPAEYGKDVIDFIEPFDYEPLVSTNCEWATLTSEKVGDALGKVYLENTTKEVYSKGVALAEKHNHKEIGKKWLRLLQDLQLPDMSEIDADGLKGNTTENIVEGYLDSIES